MKNVRTVLSFFALALVIVEALFVYALKVLEGTDRTILIVGMLTLFQINDEAIPPERRGNWGAHVAKWRAKSKSFEVLGIELKEKSNPELLGIELKEQSDSDHLAGQWIREHDLE